MPSLLVLVVSSLLCSHAVAVDCPSTWLAHAHNCYHFSHDTEEWMVARMICQSYGGDLAEVESAGEDKFLQNETNRLTGNFWIGGNDLMEEGNWVWAKSGISVTDYEYEHWNPPNPSNNGGDENCMQYSSTYDGWNDNKCMLGLKYICEREPQSQSVVG